MASPAEMTPVLGFERATTAGYARRVARGAERYALPLLLVVTYVVFAVALPAFRTLDNFRIMINSQSLVLLLAVIATTSLRAGVTDFSIAATMGVSAAIVGHLTLSGHATWVAIIVPLAVCVVIGIVQAYLVVGLGVDSFVLSLGALTALGGVTAWLTHSTTVTAVPHAVIEISQHSVAGFPITTWLSWSAVLTALYMYEFTPLGRYLLFVGGNPEAAKLAGVRVNRIRFIIMVSNSTFAGVVGILLLGQFGSIDPTVPSQFLLPPFAAAFLGASGIIPGRFNAVGTLLAAYLLVMGITGLELEGAQAWASDLFNGCALVVAVVAARIIRRLAT